ncbi:MAG: hypothetical protein IKB65_01585 [Ruminiclostridium sp.]|nr:hypothetical protein [Ruminiclostridium sp.]
MKSSAICPFDGSLEATAAVLQEADRFAEETGLTGKQSLQLRLLTEELLGMVNGVTKVRDGSFAIELKDGEYRLLLSAETFPVGERAQKRLLDTSSTGENILYQGVAGKVRMVVDWYRQGGDPAGRGDSFAGGFHDESFEEWSLVRMRNYAARERKAAKWDKLEKSVLEHLADDVRVGLRRDKVVITVHKTFHNAEV